MNACSVGVTVLFELVVLTGDHHWELESCKTAYINVDQSAERPCPAGMTASKYTQLYMFGLLVPVAGKDNQLKKVWKHNRIIPLPDSYIFTCF